MTDIHEGPRRRTGQFPPAAPRLWIGYLVVGGLAVIAYQLVPSEVVRGVIYQLVGLSAAVALVYGVRLHRPVRRAPWYLMAVGLGVWSVADGIENWWALVRNIEGFPTPADPVYLLGYVAAVAGFALLVRGRHVGRDMAGVLDSLILTTSLAALSWVLLAQPVLKTYADSPIAAVVAVGYPVADIVLAGLLIWLVTTPSGRTRSYLLLVLALATLIAADTASTALRLLTYDATDPLDLLWLVSYLAWGAAALEPSMVSLTASVPGTNTRFSRTRLAVLTVAVLIAPVTLGVQTLLGIEPTIWATVVFSILAFLLVVARMNLSIQQIQAANAEVAAAQHDLTHQAAHDPLTDLPNRAQAMRLISGAMSRAQRNGAAIGLLFVDLDGFKQVNDTLGHHAGDEVLRTVAQRMQGALRAGDAVARLGGDEFVVLLEPLDEQPAAIAVAERIIAAITEPMLLHTGHETRVGASIGLAISQDAGTDADRLLREADVAVYRAKAAGRGRIEVFDASLRDRLVRRTQLETSIQTALAGGSVEVGVEPIVELITGELAGLEARSRCRVGAELLDRAELVADLGRSPAIVELDAWTLGWAARTLATLQEQSVATMAVPVTIQHLLQDRIRDDVAQALADSGAEASRLILVIAAAELTDDLRLLANLEALRSCGVRVCLDGFGSGAATNQLMQLPISVVRLDEVLLRQLSRPPVTGQEEATRLAAPGAVHMLRLTVQTARAFGYQVIAPAVEDAIVLAAATEVGCDFGQGSAAAELLQDDQLLEIVTS